VSRFSSSIFFENYFRLGKGTYQWLRFFQDLTAFVLSVVGNIRVYSEVLVGVFIGLGVRVL
jgi:hypothetical protein